MQDNYVAIKGSIHPVIFRADGRVEDLGWTDNLFVGAGMAYLAALQSTTVTSQCNWMSVGTGTTAATLTDLQLIGQVGSRSVMASRTTGGTSLNVLTEVCTFSGFLSGVTSLVLREVGAFNAPTGGTMRSRAVYAQIILADSDFLQLSYRTTVGSW